MIALLIFQRGDSIILLPVIGLLLLVGLWSVRFMVILIGMYMAIRGIGEMIYWLLHQFGPKTYRPPDMELSELSNEGLYVLYQTFNLVLTLLGCAVSVYALFFWGQTP